MDVSSCVGENTIQPQTEVDLTEDEIQKLLCEAENRLRRPSSTAVQLKSQPENDSQDMTLSYADLYPALNARRHG